MKLIALGDTHGRSTWNTIIEKETFDKLIFIGDYFDTHEDITGEEQLINFQEIVAYKKSMPDKVVLLTGNHDFHYLADVDEVYSGFQQEFKEEFRSQLEYALENNLLQMCFRSDNYLFTHAGITKTWLKNAGFEEGQLPDVFINNLFTANRKAFIFTPGRNFSSTGNDITQPPIWVRPESLAKDAIEGYTQVVGHTPQRSLQISLPFLFIDTIGTTGEYLEINDGEPRVKKSC